MSRGLNFQRLARARRRELSAESVNVRRRPTGRCHRSAGGARSLPGQREDAVGGGPGPQSGDWETPAVGNA
eukprot:968174-Lingulodinium_polyedra.AAC.1